MPGKSALPFLIKKVSQYRFIIGSQNIHNSIAVEKSKITRQPIAQISRTAYIRGAEIPRFKTCGKTVLVLLIVTRIAFFL